MENLALIDSSQSLKMINSLIVTLMAILEDVFRNALKKKNTVQMIILTSS
jgi:hypothetical protein